MTSDLDLFEQAISSVDELCSQLTAGDWDKPTDCPGWSVKDNIAHLASYEAVAAGLAEVAADTPIDHLSEYKKGFPGDANEREIEARRPLPPDQVLDEFRRASEARLKHLSSLDAAGWEADESTFPWGSVNTKQTMPIRIFDVFYHEQDIRRAVGKPGHLDGEVARAAFRRMAEMAFPRVVGKSAAAPEGSTVVWEVPKPGWSFAVTVKDGRGVSLDPPADATVRLSSDIETALCLFGGRWTPADARKNGKLSVQGDEALAKKVLDNITVVP